MQPPFPGGAVEATLVRNEQAAGGIRIQVPYHADTQSPSRFHLAARQLRTEYAAMTLCSASRIQASPGDDHPWEKKRSVALRRGE